MIKADLATGQIIIRRAAKAFSYLFSQQKEKFIPPLRSLRLCGEKSFAQLIRPVKSLISVILFPHNRPQSTFYSVDEATLNTCGRLVVLGWIFSTKQKIVTLDLLVNERDQNFVQYTLQYNRERLDVAEIHQNPMAAHSGFYGEIPFLHSNKLYLVAGFENGEFEKIPIQRKIEGEDSYQVWIKKFEPNWEELTRQESGRFPYEPIISIIAPLFNPTRPFLIEMIESVLAQTYRNFELCLAEGSGRGRRKIKGILEKYRESESRIRVKYLTSSSEILGLANEALSLARGEYVIPLEQTDTLAPFALFEIVKVINEDPQTDFIYSDEDTIDLSGQVRFLPHFKGDFNLDLLRSINYINHPVVFKKNLLERIGFYREGYEGSQDYDLILRAVEKAHKITHIPKILYHGRNHDRVLIEFASKGNPSNRSARKALSDHLERMGIRNQATVETGLLPGSHRIRYWIKGNPSVSIIIPNKDHAEDLEKCIGSIFAKSTCRNFQILIVENHSVEENTCALYERLADHNNIRIIKWEKPFNYGAINNFASHYAEGEYLVFLNNDVEVISPDWIEQMLSQDARPEVGCVGVKLYYPNDLIQHGGVIVGLGGVAGHAHRMYRRDSMGYFGRLKTIQNVSAVTAACMMTRRDLFEKVGGFDERFIIAFNDVDLCLRIRQRGYLIVWTPYAELYHHELKTRGLEDTEEKRKRARGEALLFQEKWRNFLDKGDPYYNQNLTLDREDFSLRIS